MEEKVDIKLLSAREAAEALSVSLKQFYKIAKEDGFPRPIVLGPRLHRWRAKDIANWYDNQ